MTLAERILREAKASPPKTAALGVLLAVGCYFWIPPVWNALHRTDATVEHDVATLAVAASAETPTPPTESDRSSDGSRWTELEKIRTEDALYQPAESTEVNANAFAFNHDILPLDAELAVDPPASKPVAKGRSNGEGGTTSVDLANLAQQLHLRSTMIGGGRRAAVINNRVYSEGDVMLVAGRNVRLSSVASRRVTMDADGQSIELRIDPFAAEKFRSNP
ncbi:MAG: general secretion pathway protein GspB [Planctomycetota bacterium]|nr:hypothetical protein [Planctomycetaceae bacterium]MDQ3333185.1 general secretion pathway protein GspB [Planctomycetota bacterium]